MLTNAKFRDAKWYGLGVHACWHALNKWTFSDARKCKAKSVAMATVTVMFVCVVVVEMRANQASDWLFWTVR